MRNTAYGLQFARSIFGLTITFRTVDGLDRASHGYKRKLYGYMHMHMCVE